MKKCLFRGHLGKISRREHRDSTLGPHTLTCSSSFTEPCPSIITRSAPPPEKGPAEHAALRGAGPAEERGVGRGPRPPRRPSVPPSSRTSLGMEPPAEGPGAAVDPPSPSPSPRRRRPKANLLGALRSRELGRPGCGPRRPRGVAGLARRLERRWELGNADGRVDGRPSHLGCVNALAFSPGAGDLLLRCVHAVQHPPGRTRGPPSPSDTTTHPPAAPATTSTSARGTGGRARPSCASRRRTRPTSSRCSSCRGPRGAS